MHYQHVIALARLRHEEHQEYARQAARTARRQRRWRHMRPRLGPTGVALPKGRGIREDTARVGEV